MIYKIYCKQGKESGTEENNQETTRSREKEKYNPQFVEICIEKFFMRSIFTESSRVVTINGQHLVSR